ncbi:hypothetical protein HK103_006713 [Boothiomyces macroporosus]|uniref:AB hydrolase-1 domain-containing protein n=1 Tax=Boothiomyces macroporosus TaxID=261099 RepID=A0AAD5UD75_9FUNG|nr:hypothetical protein HK103_006713 [Boothiomyces macroporosus]
MGCLWRLLGYFVVNPGSTLALAYAIEHPYRVKAMILRGVFLLRPKELNWYYQEGGASNIFPDYWEDFVRIIPPEERNDMIAAYYKRLTGTDEKVMLEAAMAWSRWEMATSKLEVDEKLLKKVQDPMWALQFARIECHYFINKGFFKTDNHILDNIEKINHIPCHIIQGRYDVVCPMRSAWDLKQKWPIAQLHIMPTSGHSATEVAITKKIIECTDEYQTML